jgi:membrane-associated phospholipid phosphatase
MTFPGVLVRYLLLLMVFTAGAPLPVVAQEDSLHESVPSIVLADAGIALDDAVLFVTAPARFSAMDWLATGCVVGGIVVVIGSDGSLQERFASTTGDVKDLWDIPTLYGDIRFAGAVTAGTYAAGLIWRDNGLRVTGRLLFESLALSGSAMLALRFLLGRSRPSDGEGPRDFRGFCWSNAETSFPSGHATVAFAVSTVLAERIDHPLARVAFYGLAFLTAAARVHDNRHWTSDVLGGAALGLVAGFHVVGLERGREQGASEEGAFSIIPLPGGLRLQYALR